MALDMSEDDSSEDFAEYMSGDDVDGVNGQGSGGDAASDSASDNDQFDTKDWGRKKSSYYKRREESDEEASEDEAIAEEAEARRLQKEKALARQEDDFDDSFAVRTSSKSGSEAYGAKKALTSTDAGLLETMYKEMGSFAPSDLVSHSVDVSSLSKQEKLDLIVKDSPELLLLLDSLKERMREIRERIAPLIQRARAAQIPTSKGLSYLETKYHLLLNYCTNICFYLLLKAEGKSVKNHPVIDHLARTRTVIDRLKPLDQKLKYQIDKLLKLAAQGEANLQSDPKLRHRANIRGFLPIDTDTTAKHGEEGEYSDEDGLGDEGVMEIDGEAPASSSLGGDKYVAPKFAPTGDREEKRKTRAEKKAKSSAMAEYLIEEFGDRPLEHSTGVGARDKSLQEAQSEREKYEEDNFVRLGLTKKEKKATRRSNATSFVDEFADLADYGDLKALDRADALHRAEDLEERAFSAKRKKSSSSASTASLRAEDGGASEALDVYSKKKARDEQANGKQNRLASIMDELDSRAEASAAAKQHRYHVDEDIDYDGIAQEKKSKRMKLKEDRDREEAKHAIDAERRARDRASATEMEGSVVGGGKSKKEKRTAYSEMADAMEDDDEFYKEAVEAQKRAKEEKMSSSRAARSERKAERDMEEMSSMADKTSTRDGKRKVSKEIEENKGLRKTKKKELHNSRVKIKERYKTALKKLKSRGPSEATNQHRFAGTSGGINQRVVKSTQL